MPAPDGQSLGPGLLLGDFQLVSLLGQGGMSTVWEAEQLSLKRRVALKFLRPHLSDSPEAIERLHREAVAGARLDHPSIVRTYGFVTVGSWCFIVQELVKGARSLADLFKDRRERAAQDAEAGEDYPRLAGQFARLGDALELAHRAGVVHRDVKPGNILFAADGEPRLADFGLARILEDVSLSRTGEFAGTPAYMSPEQAAARRIGIDHRTDIFSLGATLYEALTLQRAFDGDTSQQVIEKILLVDPPDPRDLRSKVPRDLAVICLKAVEKRREQRYQTAAEFAEDLRRFLKHEAILARPPGPLARTGKWLRRHPVVSVAAGVAAAALLIISLLLLRMHLLFEQAVAQEEQAERRAYAASIAAAQLALDSGEAADARRLLAGCPEDLRNWEWRHLQLQAENSLATWRDNGGPVIAVAFHPDGQSFASLALNRTLLVRQIDSGEKRLEVPKLTQASSDPKYPNVELLFSPDGRRLLLRENDEQAFLLDAETGSVVAILPGGDHDNDSVCFSADGRLLALADTDKGLVVAHAADGSPIDLGAWPAAKRRARAACFMAKAPGNASPTTPSWPVLAFCTDSSQGFKGELLLVAASSGAVLAALTHTAGKPTVLVSSVDGSYLALGTLEGKVIVFDVRHVAEPVQVFELEVQPRVEVNRIGFSGDNRSLIVNRFIETSWHALGRQGLTDGHFLTRRGPDMVGSDADLNDARGRAVVVRHSNGLELSLLEAGEGRPLGVLTGHDDIVTDHVFSADGRRLLTSSLDGTVRLWDTMTGSHRAVLPLRSTRNSNFLSLSADGQRLAYAHSADQLGVHSARDGEILRVLSLDEKPLASVDEGPATTTAPPPRIIDAAFLPAGNQLAAVANDLRPRPEPDAALILWNAETGESRRSALLPESFTRLAALPEGRFVATIGQPTADASSTQLTLWEVDRLVPAAQTRLQDLTALSLSAAPNGRDVAVGYESGLIEVWSVTDGRSVGQPLTFERVTSLPMGAGPVRSLAFSPDGSLLAAGFGEDVDGPTSGEIQLWTTSSWQLAGRRLGHRSAIRCVRFDPQGERLASTAWSSPTFLDFFTTTDCSLRLWDTGEGLRDAELLVVRSVQQAQSERVNASRLALDALAGQTTALEFNAVEFSRDGKRLFATTQSGLWVGLTDAADAQPCWAKVREASEP